MMTPLPSGPESDQKPHMNHLQSKPVPLSQGVLVVRFDDQGQPWPVATIHIDQAGKIAFTGDSGKAYAALLNATKKCASRLATQGVKEALRESHNLRNNPTPVTSADELPAAGEVF